MPYSPAQSIPSWELRTIPSAFGRTDADLAENAEVGVKMISTAM